MPVRRVSPGDPRVWRRDQEGTNKCPGGNMSVLISLMIGCGSSSTPVSSELSAGNANTGKEIYEKACVSCHGTDGMGDEPLYMVPDLADEEMWDVIYYGIDDPQNYMPAYDYYTTQEIADVIAWMRQLM